VFLGLNQKGDKIYASYIQITRGLYDYIKLYGETTSNIATNKDFRPPSNPYFHIHEPEIVKLCERTETKGRKQVIDRELER
jgi:hypothetical protein